MNKFSARKKVSGISPIYKFGLVLFTVMVVLVAAGSFQPPTAYADSAVVAPAGIGNFDSWTANTGAKVDAVAANDGDATFISSTSTAGAETFSFSGAAVPAGATINSVTLTAEAEAQSGFAEIQLLAENGGSPVYEPGFGNPVNNAADYEPVVWTMTANPLTNVAWALADVNAWNLNFGVANVAGFSGVKVSQIFLSVDYTVNPVPAPNPALAAQTCGLDIALVLDNSGSIGGNLPTMKTVFNNFVGSLVPGTPTDFSVTYFNTSAFSTLPTFSNSAASIISAINAVPAAFGQTNWQDGLVKAQASFDPRPGSSHPNLIIFASDGQPNRYYDASHTLQGIGGTVDQNALNAAVTEANLIKSAGTRILTLGIGASVNQANMEDISSADAYYSVANFSQLAGALSTIAGQMCGGTITINKKIDADGNLATAGDQTGGGAGFTFNITPGYSGQLTDTNGQTPAVAVAPGIYSLAETAIPGGYSALGGSCSGAANDGTASGTTVSGLEVGASDIVSCTFYNTPSGGGAGTSTPGGADIGILKSVDKTAANPGDSVNFTLAVINNGPAAATGVTASDILPLGLTFVSATSTAGSYDATSGLWTIGNLAAGSSATTTLTAAIASSTAGQVLTNIATASSTSFDSISANNSASASVAVNSPAGGGGGGGGPSADLSLAKTVDNAAPDPGSIINYTLVVHNLGPDDAVGAMATDTLPAAVSFVSATSTAGSYDATSGLWTIGNLAAGSSATTTITAMVSSSAAGQSVANTAIAASATLDPDLSNNSSSAGGLVSSPGSGGGSSGGGSSSSGGGGGGPAGNGSPLSGGLTMPVNNGGQSFGSSTNVPAGQVLGASTALPRTGLPVVPILLLFGIIAAIWDKKFKLL